MAKHYNGEDVYVQIKNRVALGMWNKCMKCVLKKIMGILDWKCEFLTNRMPPFFNRFFGANNFKIAIFLNPGS
jgi:hypothetical protein